jgi:hypothetical protein
MPEYEQLRITKKEIKMNTIKKVSTSARRWIMSLAGAALVFGMAFTFPTSTTLAAAPTPAAGTGAGGTLLSLAYQHEQQVLGIQQTNLDKSAGAISKVQDLISKAGAKGVDTSALDSALATFQEQLATANASHATAAGILSAHNGFDDSGNVTDINGARQTVQDARQNLLDAHNILRQALIDLRASVRTWGESTKDQFQNDHLQKDYQNEQTWLSTQQGNLALTDNVVTKVQDLISKAQAKGLDTSSLSSALTTFQAEIATANSSHNTAAGILSTHNGFDASGNVTDQAPALQTVKDAHQSLMDAHITLMQALKDLQTAVQQWRAANAPSLTPAATPISG